MSLMSKFADAVTSGVLHRMKLHPYPNHVGWIQMSLQGWDFGMAANNERTYRDLQLSTRVPTIKNPLGEPVATYEHEYLAAVRKNWLTRVFRRDTDITPPQRHSNESDRADQKAAEVEAARIPEKPGP